MTDPKIDTVINEIHRRMITLYERKFFGKILIEVEYKAGGMSAVHIGDREKIL